MGKSRNTEVFVDTMQSFYALDLYAITDGTQGTAPIREAARAHVEDVRAARAVPSWVRELAAPALPWWRRSSRVAVGASLFALAALLLFLSRPESNAGHNAGLAEPDGHTSIKGAADIAVYVKRDGRVFRWDTEELLHVGDSVRLEVAPAGFTRVTVFADTEADLKPLYEGALNPLRSNLLDVAWQLDANGGDDVILVVLSHTSLDLDDTALRHSSSRPLWTKRIRLREATEK